MQVALYRVIVDAGDFTILKNITGQEEFTMRLKDIIRKINEMCKGCSECEPCCTGNILKKYIETKKPILKTA